MHEDEVVILQILAVVLLMSQTHMLHRRVEMYEAHFRLDAVVVIVAHFRRHRAAIDSDPVMWHPRTNPVELEVTAVRKCIDFLSNLIWIYFRHDSRYAPSYNTGGGYSSYGAQIHASPWATTPPSIGIFLHLFIYSNVWGFILSYYLHLL